MLRGHISLPRFLPTGEIILGEGSLGALRALDCSRALLIVSASLMRDSEQVQKIRKAVSCHELLMVEGIRGEPDLARLQPLVARASEFRPDWIVAIGGGSIMDSAKLVWAFYEHPDLDFEIAVRPFALPDLRGKARLAAIPTTAGSGSEVSSAAVLSDEQGRKMAVVSHQLLPDLVILDPDLSVDLPRNVAVAAGLDALAHALECVVSRYANPLADVLAEKATQIIFSCLPAAVSNPGNTAARMRMMQAALLAGWVQNLKVPGIGHAVAHQLGRWGIPHGVATGSLLAAAVELNSQDDDVRATYDTFAQTVGLADTKRLVARVREFCAEIEAPTLSQASRNMEGGLFAHRHVIFEKAREDPCARANPLEVTAARVEELIERAIG